MTRKEREEQLAGFVMNSGIQMYMHCASCMTGMRKDTIAVGMKDAHTIRVVCETCGMKVADFATVNHLLNSGESNCEICEKYER